MTRAAETKDRILDAAETLFAEKGFAAASLRALTTEAGANLAAVNYHFGSKENLFLAVIMRRIDPLNRERIQRLDTLETTSLHPDLDEILDAFLRPALELARQPGGRTFMRIAGRIYTEPGDHWAPVAMQFEEVKDRFLAALARALPDLPQVALLWRVHFMIGAMCHTLADTYRLHMLSGGVCDPSDVDGMCAHLVPFVAAGFRAPVPTLHLGERP